MVIEKGGYLTASALRYLLSIQLDILGIGIFDIFVFNIHWF